MITEDGSIKTARIEDSGALSLYRKKYKIVSLILLIVGVVGTLVYIVLGTVLGGPDEDAPRWVDIFLVFAVPLALGLIGSITISRLKSRERKEGRTSECTFYADCFFYSLKSAQGTTVDKFAYSDAVLKRENEKYGYIFVQSRGAFLVFSKEGLQDSELNAIRKRFGQSTEGGIAELKNYNLNEQ